MEWSIRARAYYVSIVIPCFNQGSFLKEAIQSVLTQTHRADQLIVVDDGSTDDTAAVAAEFPVADYVFQQNRGLSAPEIPVYGAHPENMYCFSTSTISLSRPRSKIA